MMIKFYGPISTSGVISNWHLSVANTSSEKLVLQFTSFCLKEKNGSRILGALVRYLSLWISVSFLDGAPLGQFA